MKKALALLACALCATATGYAAPGEVIATVNGKAITQQMLDAYIKQRGIEDAGTLTPERKKSITDELVNRELLSRLALKKGLEKQANFTTELESARLNILASAAVRAEMQTQNALTDEKLQEAYKKFVAELSKTEYKVRHLLAEKEETAKGWAAQLDKGTSFAKVAEDSTNSAKEAGELDWFEPSQMIESFSAAVMKLKKGEYTKAPVQTQYGWHVILLEDTRPLAPPPFESVKEQISLSVRNAQIENLIKGLREKAKIEMK